MNASTLRTKHHVPPRKTTKLEEAMHEAQAMHIEIPSTRRVVCAHLAAIAVNIAWLTPVWSVFATLTVSTSIFATLVLWALTLIITSYLAMKVANVVVDYIVTKTLDRHIAAAKRNTLGLFARRNEVPA